MSSIELRAQTDFDGSPSWWSAGVVQVPSSDEWVDDAEAQRFGGMRFAKRRSESMLARFTAKTTVAKYLGLPSSPAELRRVTVRNAADGAPFVEVTGHAGNLEIAMTDRADWAVCAVAGDCGRIGCDLELVEPRSLAFVRDYLTPAEQSLVVGVDADMMANLIWSAKESALKVLRTGLRRDTRTVEASLGDRAVAGWNELSVTVDSKRRLPGWWVRYGDFVLTFVSEERSNPPASLESPPPLASAEPGHGWMEALTAE